MTGLGVYGFVPAGSSLGRRRGAHGEPLRLVAVGAVAAVVGPVTDAPPLDPASLRAHDAAVRRLARGVDALLPARFGSRLPDDAAVAALLEARGSALAPALALVAGRVQMTVRLVGEPLPGPPDAFPGASGPGPGARYLARRRAAREVPEAAPLRAALEGLVAAERARRHDRPPLVASLYHLVARGSAGAYARRVAAEAGRLSPLHVWVSGPWPPYAFGEATS